MKKKMEAGHSYLMEMPIAAPAPVAPVAMAHLQNQYGLFDALFTNMPLRDPTAFWWILWVFVQPGALFENPARLHKVRIVPWSWPHLAIENLSRGSESPATPRSRQSQAWVAEAPKDLSGYYYGYYSGYSGYYYDQAKKQEVPKEVKAEKAAWPPSSEHFGADEDDVMNNVLNHSKEYSSNHHQHRPLREGLCQIRWQAQQALSASTKQRFGP